MTSLILTSNKVVHNKEYRIRPQGIHCPLRAKPFSGVTLAEQGIFTEYQKIQSQMVLFHVKIPRVFKRGKKKTLYWFATTLCPCLVCHLKKHNL